MKPNQSAIWVNYANLPKIKLMKRNYPQNIINKKPRKGKGKRKDKAHLEDMKTSNSP